MKTYADYGDQAKFANFLGDLIMARSFGLRIIKGGVSVEIEAKKVFEMFSEEVLREVLDGSAHSIEELRKMRRDDILHLLGRILDGFEKKNADQRIRDMTKTADDLRTTIKEAKQFGATSEELDSFREYAADFGFKSGSD